MNKQLLALHLARGRLQERITHQRAALALELLPLAKATATASRLSAVGRGALGFVRSNPLLMLAALAVLLMLRPKCSWRLAKTGLIVWRGWRTLRALLPAPVLSSLYQFILQRFIVR